MWKKILILAVVVFGLGAGKAKAYYVPDNPELNLVVDKKVRGFSDEYFYDNVDRTFWEGDVIEFEVRVKNNGNKDLTDIQVIDKLPKKLKMLLFPGNLSNNQLNWQIDRLSPGEEKKFLLRAKIEGTSASEFENKSQMTNFVEAKSGEIYDSDQAAYFLGSKSVPETGSELMIVQTLLGISAAGAGWGLRKKVRGY